MSASAAQPALPLPGWSPDSVKRSHRQSGRHLRPVLTEPPTVRYTPLALSPDQAVQQALEALTAAGLRQHVSRIVVWPVEHLRGCLATVALLRHGADPGQVHGALVTLPGVQGSHCGEASVSIYWQVTP